MAERPRETVTTTSRVLVNSTFTAPAAQIIPTAKPGTATSTDQSANDFPTAAIAVVAIVCGLIAIFIAYRVYVWWYRRKQRYVVPLPAARSYATPPSPGLGPTMTFVDHPGGMGARTSSTFGLVPNAAAMGRTREASWMISDNGSASPSGALGEPWSPGAGYHHSNASSGATSPLSVNGGLPNHSRSPSPFGVHSPEGSVIMPSSTSRASVSSVSGGMPRRHMMFGSNSMVNAPNQMRSQPSSSRLSGAPHAAHSRIDIVPPSPLAPPPGTVIAKGKASLDFAPSSGIGNEQTAETLLDTTRFSTNQPPNFPSSTYDSRMNAFEQARAARAHSSVSGSSVPDSASLRSSPHHHHYKARSSLGSVPTSPRRDHAFRPSVASSSSSSEDPSPNSSSIGLAASRRLPPLHISTQSSPSALPLSTMPTSPLDKLQQQIAQQQARTSIGAATELDSESGSASTGGRTSSVAEIEGFQAPRDRLDQIMNEKPLPRR